MWPSERKKEDTMPRKSHGEGKIIFALRQAEPARRSGMFAGRWASRSRPFTRGSGSMPERA
jgi:hypothetical protein